MEEGEGNDFAAIRDYHSSEDEHFNWFSSVLKLGRVTVN
jgi:hypothetical protein